MEAGRFDDAIITWLRIPQPDDKLRAALAEAYFRRALTRLDDAARLPDLRHAVELQPEDPRYLYQLGLALHRTGELQQAVDLYERVLRRNPDWRGAGLVLALARLEQDSRADLSDLPGQTPRVSRTVAPVQALLRKAPLPALGDSAIERFWRGLAAIREGDGSAQEILADDSPLPRLRTRALRHYYRGVAAAQAGDFEGAWTEWQQAQQSGVATPWLRNNLAATLLERLSKDDGGDQAQIADQARAAVPLAAGNIALAEPLVAALDRAARHAAAKGDWALATTLWQDARQVVAANAGMGSPRPILHNLALAHEAQEQWMAAAEMWRALLRTRPRKGGGAGPLGDAHWGWVRKRVVECYKRAGAPGEAVAIFRQAIKAAPDDVEVRLQLVDALIANGQEQAAYNEVERILGIDPANVDAQLRGSALLAARGDFDLARIILEPALAQQPPREDVRRQMGAVLLAEGQQNMRWFNFAGAERAFEEARRYSPEDWKPPLFLARIAISQKDLQRAREMLQTVLELAGEQPDAYFDVIDCWVVAEDLDEVRAVVARAAAVLPLAAGFYIQVAMILLQHDQPPPLFGAFSLTPPKRKTKETPRARLAAEMLDRAMAMEPDNGRMRVDVAAQLARIDPKLGLRYAEEGAAMQPDAAEPHMVLAILQAANGLQREAKETLRRGARLARTQGLLDLAEQMEDMRRHVDDPMLPLMLQMGSLLDDWEDEDDEIW